MASVPEPNREKQKIRLPSTPPQHFVVVLGPSRSGTTLLAATLHAHPRIQIYFEPMETRLTNPPPVFSTIQWFESFCAHCEPTHKVDRAVLGFKETLGRWETFSWINDTLRHFAVNNRDIPISCLVIVRDPFEAYLSRGDGLRKWWGNKEWSPDPVEAAADVIHTAKGVVAMHELATRFGGLVLSYKAFVTHPAQAIERITTRVGLETCNAQLNYHLNGPMQGVNGDLGVAEDPKPISADRYEARKAEARRFRESCSAIRDSQIYRTLSALIEMLDAEIVSDVSDARLFGAVDALRDAVRIA